MKREAYIQMTEDLLARPGLLKLFTFANKIAPWVYTALYAFIVLAIAPVSPIGAIRLLMVPLGSFLIVQLATHFLDYPRPYQKFGIHPAIPEITEDSHSLPSKQAFWYTIVGLAYFFVLNNHLYGVILLACAAFLCGIRVWGGLHFTRDILAGIALALIFGLLGFM